MPIFDSGVFDAGVFDSQPVNQINGRADFDASVIGAARAGHVGVTVFPDGESNILFGDVLHGFPIYAAGWVDSVVGDHNAQWRKFVYPDGAYLDDGFGTGGSVRDPAYVTGSLQQITVPYFFDTSIPATAHAYAKITGLPWTAVGTFGNLTHRTWIFTVGNTLTFGSPVVGQRPALVIDDSRFPGYNSLLYSFGTSYPPKIYCFGLDTKWTPPNVVAKVDARLPLMEFGQVGVVGTTIGLSINSTRFPSVYTAIPFSFGGSTEIHPDPMYMTQMGVPGVFNCVTAVVIPSTAFGDTTTVSRRSIITLILRDTKSVTPPSQPQGVLFQWGFPKKDILAIGISSGYVSNNIRFPKTINAIGFDAAKIPRILDGPDVVGSWYYPELLNAYRGIPVYGHNYALYGSSTISNLNQTGIYPKYNNFTLWSPAAVSNVKKSIHPAGPKFTAYGTPSLSIKQKVITVPGIQAGWVWYPVNVLRVETQTIGYVHSMDPPAMPAVTMVSGNWMTRTIDESIDDGWFGIHEVKVDDTPRPGFEALQFGAAQVTHYTRYLGVWQPWKDSIIGGVQRVYHQIRGVGFRGQDAAFGDMYQWKAGMIQMHPTEMVGVMGSPRIRMEILFHKRVNQVGDDLSAIGAASLTSVPVATTQQIDATLGDQQGASLPVARRTLLARGINSIDFPAGRYGTATLKQRVYETGFNSGAFANPAALRPGLSTVISSGDVGTPRMMVPVMPVPWWDTNMGAQPTVVYGTSFYVCGCQPRAVVPKEFAKTQFGDFDAFV